MKRAVLIAVIIASTAPVWAGEMPEGWAPPKLSAELMRIKALEGQWTGSTTEKPGETKPVTLTYKVTSGGSAVVETIDPGTSHEMVSIYHDIGGKLSMTHYCMLGNQPELELKGSTPTSLVLSESAASASTLSGQMRMGQLTVEQPDANTLTQTWTAQDASGKLQEPCVFKLQRAA